MNEMLELGRTALNNGYLDQAENYYNQVASTPDCAGKGYYGLGLVALKRGDTGQAREYLRRAEPAMRGDPDFHVNYATALRYNKRLQDAVEQNETALRIDEQHPRAWAGLGHCLADNGDTDMAVRYFIRALQSDPDMPDVKLALGGCLHKRGDYHGALGQYREALDNHPDSDEARYMVGQTLYEASRTHEALEYLYPLRDHPRLGMGARGFLASCWLAMGRAEEALEVLQGIQAPQALAQRYKALGARALNMLGRNDEAVAICREILAETPDNAMAWQYWLDMENDALPEPELARLREAAEAHPDNGLLQVALAEALERIGDYAGQWRALEQGNARLAEQHFYSAERAEHQARVHWEHCTRSRLVDWAAHGDPDFRPVFIMGMPRSGTTLVEQILGSHSRVDTAGESGALSYVLDEYIQRHGLKDHRGLYEVLDGDVIAELAPRVRDTFREMGLDSPWVVEKSINNMETAGLLYALFPNAAFVVVQRHPLDVTFGCFKRAFNHQAFSFTLEGCAHQYALYYHKFLSHWQRELPTRLHELHYEDLVSDQERTTRALVDYLGLPWEDACLNFHENERQVGTASLNQVRTGLFSSAVGRWERYGELLDPLREALRAEGVEV